MTCRKLRTSGSDRSCCSYRRCVRVWLVLRTVVRDRVSWSTLTLSVCIGVVVVQFEWMWVLVYEGTLIGIYDSQGQGEQAMHEHVPTGLTSDLDIDRELVV